MGYYDHDYSEDEYFAENEKIKDRKKIHRLNANEYDEEVGEKSRPRLIKIPCCLFLVAIFILSGVVIYYVYSQIKDPLYEKILMEKQALENLQGKIEDIGNKTRDTIEVGKNKVNEADYTIENIEQKIDSVKNAYDKVQEITQDLKDLSGYTKQTLE